MEFEIVFAAISWASWVLFLAMLFIVCSCFLFVDITMFDEYYTEAGSTDPPAPGSFHAPSESAGTGLSIRSAYCANCSSRCTSVESTAHPSLSRPASNADVSSLTLPNDNVRSATYKPSSADPSSLFTGNRQRHSCRHPK